MKSLHEIIFLLITISIIYLNGEERLFGLCFGVAYMPGVYFAYFSYFLFQKQVKKLRSDLDQVISELHTELNKTFFLTDKMTARRNYIFTNKYIPPATKTVLKWYEQDLNTWYNEMKYKEATENPNQYFSNVKFVNFDIIHHDIRKSYKNRLKNIRQLIKLTLMDTIKNLRMIRT